MPHPSKIVVKRCRFATTAVALLAALALSGCGGGGGGVTNSTSTTSNGYRIVPAGGPVIPQNGVVLNTASGVVSQGVQVSSASVNPSALPSAPSGYSLLPDAAAGAYRLSLSPSMPPLNSTIIITLSYTAAGLPKDPGTGGNYDTRRLQIFTLNGGQWQPLPLNSVNTSSNTVSAAVNGSGDIPGTNFPFTLQTFSDSGIYAIFGSIAPVQPVGQTGQSVPVLTSLSGNTSAAGSPTTVPVNQPFTLTLLGTGLQGVTQVTIGSQTVAVSASQITGGTSISVPVPASDVATAGTYAVSVTNPSQSPLYTTSNLEFLTAQ